MFRKTGTSHLIAISGLHIGLVGALVFWFVRWVCLRIQLLNRVALQSAVLSSLLMAVLYAGLAGFSVPTQRALIMVTIVLAVVIHDPLSIMAVGFWLSFGAVAIILYGMVGRMSEPHVISKLLRTQWIVSIGLMPSVLYFFQQASVVSPLANAVVVPWVSFLIAPLLLFVLPVGALSDVLGLKGLALVDELLDILWVILIEFAHVEWSQLAIPRAPLWACAIAMVGVLLFLLPKGLVPRLAACLLFVPLIFPMKNIGLPKGDVKLVLLDVGQGLSAVVETANHSLVFDTGAKFDEQSDLASVVINPYLLGEQAQQVDTLIVSHGDNDHAGGAATLLSQMTINSVLTSVPERFADHSATLCTEGMRWRWGDVEFEILNPSRFNLFEGNNGSCVLKVTSAGGSVLLTGDIENRLSIQWCSICLTSYKLMC